MRLVRFAHDDALTAQEQIEAALDLSQLRFRGGVGIGLEVLDAEAALSDLRTNGVTAIVAYDTAQIAFRRAVGGISAASLRDPATDGDRP